MTLQQEGMFQIVCNVMRLSEAVKEHTLKDELCGDHVVIPVEKLDELISKFEENVVLMCGRELQRRGRGKKADIEERPLVDAILLMKNKKDGKAEGNTDKPQTADHLREVDVGEVVEQDTVGRAEGGSD